jgi:hypothetical protein
MGLMKFIECRSFREALVRASVVPRGYVTSTAAMEAVDLLAIIVQLGDHVLELVHAGHLGDASAEAILRRLLFYYAEPIANAKDIAHLRTEVGGYNK